MANLFVHKNRNILPNFRGFKETIELGELNNFIRNIHKSNLGKISSELLQWEKNKSIGAASDLLSSAFVSGVMDIDSVKNASEYILSNKEKATISQISLAEKILNRGNSNNNERVFSHLSSFIEGNTKESIYEKIKSLKNAINRFQNNPVLYAELARYYSILGQKEKALRCINTAICLAPNNRYILRSFIRLQVHYNNKELAHDYLRKQKITITDPWLLSAEIGLATLIGSDSRFLKTGYRMLNSKNFSDFSLGELRSGLGTIELLEGSRRKSRDLFRNALIDPNDNTVAQVEWALGRDKLFDLDLESLDVKRNFEALALDAYENKQWEKSLTYLEKWFMDMPFSKTPILYGGHISSVILDDQDSAIKFYKAGLISHHGDYQLINNLAYSLALANRTEEANKLLENVSLSQVEDQSTKVCLIATQGLIHFREKNHDLGRICYLDAIEEAKKISDATFSQLAILNYAREEVMLNSPYAEAIMKKIGKLKIDDKMVGSKILYEKIVNLYQQNKILSNISKS